MSDNSHIVQSLAVNVSIAVAKGIAAAVTLSGAMLAEAIHSAADCANQVLLLIGVRAAARAPSAAHPLGHGRAAYFWSFLVALLLFSIGGLFSIVEGVHKLLHPTPVDHPAVAFVVLGISAVLEGAAALSNLREMKARRGTTPLARWLRQTKDADLIVVFGENAAAVVGLALAIAALAAAGVTGDPRWDGAGSVGVGAVLVVVAALLAVETSSLLVGEAADPRVEQAVRETLVAHPDLTALYAVITVQQGPGEVLLALKVRVASHLSADQVAETINAFERDVHARCPEVRWSFVEPDLDA